MNQIIPIPHAKISNSKIVLYTELFGRSYKNCGQKSSLMNLENNRVKGVLSKGSKKSIKTNVNLWIDALEAKKFMSRKTNEWLKSQITFCTLTLPASQMHTDKEIKRDLLNHFLISVKRKQNTNTSIWVAEKQKNGNIHFHILYNKYIHWRDIRTTWNAILEPHGYIENYRQNQKHYHKNGFNLNHDLIEKWNEEKQYKAYQYGMLTNWSDPNSTDIHSLEKVKNIANYITKYMTKGNENLKIDGRLWSGTENFQLLKKCDLIIDSEVEAYIQHELNNKNVEKYDAEQYSIISGTSLKELRNKSPSTYKKYMEIQNHNYQILYT